MRKALIVGAGLMVIIVAVYAGIALLPREQDQVVDVPIDPFNPLLSTGQPSSGSSQGGDDARDPVALFDGSIVYIPDFTKEEQPSWAGPSYLISGSPTDEFMITYYPPDDAGADASFLVSLQSEPLGEVRMRAEASLRTRLALSDQQLCQLPVSVYTQPGLSEVYQGINLGLSFCPGAVRLP